MRYRRIITLSAVFVLVTASLVALLLAPGLAAHAARKPVRFAQRVSAAIPAATCAPQVFSRTPSPNVGTSGSVLTDIAATSSSDVWAVGYSGYINSNNQSLIEHFGGSTWTVVSSANPGATANALQGVTALAANNAWTVGFQLDSFSAPAASLVEHWNGSTWSAVSSPNAQSSYTYLQAVSALIYRRLGSGNRLALYGSRGEVIG